MCETWYRAFKMYNWKVNLGSFQEAQHYEGYFNQVIQTVNDVIEFENKFRNALESSEYIVAGEVSYWKNYGNHKARNGVAISPHYSRRR